MQTASKSGYLTLTRIDGDPSQLLEGYRRSTSVMNGVGREHGLILHAAARTDEGLLIVNLWPSEEGSESAARDPRRLGAIEKHDLSRQQFQREHHDLANLVLFEPAVA